MEKISIIVPIYNVESCVEKCIQSILAQTYENLEILLIDDGSTDHSGEICDRYAAQDARIRVVHKQNEGLSDARNTGLSVCTGSYVGFVDGDDYLAPDMYRFLMDAIEESGADISICGHYLADDEGAYEEEGNEGDVLSFSRREAVEAIVRDTLIHSFAWDKLYKKALFDGITYPTRRYVQDIFTTYLVFDRAEKIVYHRRPMYYYYQRRDSIQRTRGEKLNWDQFESYREQLHNLEKSYPELRDFMLCRLAAFSVAAYNCLLLEMEKEDAAYNQRVAAHREEIRRELALCRPQLKAAGASAGTRLRVWLCLRGFYRSLYRRAKKH